MKKMVLGKLPSGEFPPEKFLPIKLPPRKSLEIPKKFLTWNVPTHFIYFLSSVNITSF